jgi:hypothetical protein
MPSLQGALVQLTTAEQTGLPASNLRVLMHPILVVEH